MSETTQGSAKQERKPIICDGCNVRGFHEHRCHEDRAFVNEVDTRLPCECPLCAEVRATFPLPTGEPR